ncbi:hypothetical protein MBLNU230_g4689t1 [Neophaeotheca triangularis]
METSTPPPEQIPLPDPFSLPSQDALRDIARKQDERAREIKSRRAELFREQALAKAAPSDMAQQAAAEVIQRSYRGHRQRRALKGHSLEPGQRLMEIVKDAKWEAATRPLPRRLKSSMSETGFRSRSQVRRHWKSVAAIARRAGSAGSSGESVEEDAGEDAEEMVRLRELKSERKAEREKYGKAMGLEYFLEMVDQKHRYGSNLRRYHKEWKAADTRENFFYWLDYGEGAKLDLEDRPRERLDREQVRYLSREERKKYLVNIQSGRFCFAKNDMPITTSPEYKDSMEGIVPAEKPVPSWREVTTGLAAPEPDCGSDSSSSISGISTGSAEDNTRYANTELQDAKGLNKLKHINVDSLKNNLLRKTTKKNTWIFVADSSFRLYVGIKQSGAFQHSSFLHGSRVAAAGLIKIKRGQLRKLSPLSGHYAPPLRNFREFVKNLKAAGADMSRCSISRSYAVLLGLEGYLGVKKHAQKSKQGVKDALHPEEKRKRQEEARDKSKSAEKERITLEEERRERRKSSLRGRIVMRLKHDECGKLIEEKGSEELGGSMGDGMEPEEKKSKSTGDVEACGASKL